MPLAITCPECQATLQVQEQFAGKKVRCPKCSATLTAEEGLAEALPVEAVTTARRSSSAPTRQPAAREEEEPCPECGEMVRAGARRCRHCKAWLDEDDEDEDDGRPVRRGKWVPCPRCGAKGAERVVWTFWGSFYGPALFSHVRCPDCRYAYNGKTGGSNLIPAIIFVTLPLLLIVAILGGLAFVIFKTMGPA